MSTPPVVLSLPGWLCSTPCAMFAQMFPLCVSVLLHLWVSAQSASTWLETNIIVQISTVLVPFPTAHSCLPLVKRWKTTHQYLFLLASHDLSDTFQGKRYSLPNSRIMIHQPLGGAQGQAADIEIQANEIMVRKFWYCPMQHFGAHKVDWTHSIISRLSMDISPNLLENR